MYNTVSIKEELESSGSLSSKFITLPFYHSGKVLDSKEEPHGRWGMTLLTAGSMRFRWNETNSNRTETLQSILKTLESPFSERGSNKEDCLKILPLELIHSKIVYNAKSLEDTKNRQGDGIITDNPLLVPAVTVADCLPLFLYDKKKKAFGAFHSGWKGTGIAGEGVRKLIEDYSSSTDDICAAIGPHIGDCCYFVDESRAEYFTQNFGPDCIRKISSSETFKSEEEEKLALKFSWRLSLTQANLYVLKEAGIPEENIVIARDCTCCTSFKNGTKVFGSFRRQAAFLPPEVDNDTRSRSMTVQTAFTFLNL